MYSQRIFVGLHLTIVVNVEVAGLLVDEVDTNAGIVAGSPFNLEIRQ